MRPRTVSLTCPEAALAMRKKISKDVRCAANERTFLDVMSVFQIILPPFQNMQKQLSDFVKKKILDNNMLEDLTKARVINFSPRLVPLMPLSTKGEEFNYLIIY